VNEKTVPYLMNETHTLIWEYGQKAQNRPYLTTDMTSCDRCGKQNSEMGAKTLWYYSKTEKGEWLCENCHPELSQPESTR
jgi:hypothetical protein